MTPLIIKKNVKDEYCILVLEDFIYVIKPRLFPNYLNNFMIYSIISKLEYNLENLDCLKMLCSILNMSKELGHPDFPESEENVIVCTKCHVSIDIINFKYQEISKHSLKYYTLTCL